MIDSSRVYELQLGAYPTPINLSYAWSFGSLSGLVMFVQVFSGVLIDSVYIGDESVVSYALEALNRDSFGGWLLRGVHSNVPSMIFAALYLHQARSLLIGSRNAWGWTSGWLIVLLTIITAFLGYSSIWAQMSYWAATVITSLVTVVPTGGDLLQLIWGAPVVGQPTLTRFICFHYLLAIVTIALAALHMVAVHYVGSSNPALVMGLEKIPFMDYFASKDALPLAIGSAISLVFVLLVPTFTMDTELYLSVNSMSTPEHIVPEWYLLSYYAVLRCVPNKAAGCLAAVFLLFLLLTSVTKDFDELAAD